MTVGLGILSFNHPNITHRTVSSALELLAPHQIVLFHHGSRAENIDQLKKAFPTISHHQTEWNKGFSGGANELLRFCFQKWDWVYFLTNDTQLLSLPLPPVVPALYAPLIYRRKLEVIDSIGGIFKPQDQKIFHLKNLEQWGSVLPGEYLYVPGTAFLLHQSIFETVGPFDESLHTYWEDVDFSMRLQNLSLPILPLPEFQLIHSVGKTCHKDSFYTKELFQRNKHIVSLRYKRD